MHSTLLQKRENLLSLKKKTHISTNATLRLIFTFERFIVLRCALLLLVSSCKDSGSVDKAVTQLTFEIAKETGITFSNRLKSDLDLNILNYLYYYNGAGVAIGDFNNDGLDDVYFTSNQGADELYINQGGLKFKNSTSQAGIVNDKGWTTGVTTVDVNNDGLLDIYLSKVSGHLKLTDKNKLYVNQGVDELGIPRFQEQAAIYGLDIGGFSSQASFFDYDLDGDLDAFILRHSLYPNSNYGSGTLRKTIDSLSGDLLLENRSGTYVDVTQKAHIFSSRLGYGLGISMSDLNADGYPDIYIGNDFFENDYLYLNQKDGTFKERNTTEGILGHTSHFSMGNAIEDINNDGTPDIVSVDMLPENLATFKSSGQEYNYAILQNQLRYGYKPQFMQNTLHLNLGNDRYAETAFLSGMAASEWSWAPLLADFNNDGLKDLYITNGILGASNDMDFINFISTKDVQKQLGKNMEPPAMEFIKKLPKKKNNNYFFKNIGNAQFKNVNHTWHDPLPSFSNGASYGDLDNDGDLDIVVNNINDPAFILENKTSKDSLHSNYIKLKFEGPSSNTLGIGAKVTVYTKGSAQYFQNYPTTGYLSARAPTLFVGLSNLSAVDSLEILWPDMSKQTLKNVPTNQTLSVKASEASKNDSYKRHPHVDPSLLSITEIPIAYVHQDSPSLEFSRDPLIPYATTNLGPKITVGDLNADGLDDLITLGGKAQKTTYHLQQQDGTFVKKWLPEATQHEIHEDVHSVIFDANGDGKKDILIVSGGNEFVRGKPLQPRLYLHNGKDFDPSNDHFENIFINASKATAIDLDNDNDQDLVIIANVSPRAFGKTPPQYIFINDGIGNFKDMTDTYSPELRHAGNLYDIAWKDLNNDGYPDAVIAGHWIPITIFINDGKSLKPLQTGGLENTHGWWNTVEVADFDNDGDFDIMAGNWGLNTRLHPTIKEPVRLYRADFDNNDQVDPIVTYFYNGQESTIATKDEMVKQLPYLNKKFLSYTAFAKANIEELLGKDELQNSEVKEAYEFASIYFENNGNNTFKSHTLPFLVQASTVHDIFVEDFNNDGYLDALLVGNNYEISTQLGQLDSSHGVLLINDQKGGFAVAQHEKFNISGASRSIENINIKDQPYYMVSRNNDTLLFLKSSD